MVATHREAYRALDAVPLLAEMRAAQKELGARIGKRGLNQRASESPYLRAIARRHYGRGARHALAQQRQVQTCRRMPSKLDRI